MKNLYQFVVYNPLPDVDHDLTVHLSVAKNPCLKTREPVIQALKMGKGNDEYHVYIMGMEMTVLEAFKLCQRCKLMIERWGLE